MFGIHHGSESMEFITDLLPALVFHLAAPPRSVAGTSRVVYEESKRPLPGSKGPQK